MPDMGGMCAVAGLWFVFNLSSVAGAQVRMTSPVPPTPDGDEIIEEVDSATEGSVFSAIEADSQAVVAEMDNQSVRDKHKDYRFGVAAMLGQVKPWQSYGLEIGWLASPAWYLAIYGGRGKMSGSGTLADRLSYRAELASEGGGALARYYLSQFDFINFEGSLSFHRWHGSLKSLNTDDGATGDRVTAYQFTGKGGACSLAMNIGWVTGGGYYFEWTPIGVQMGRLVQMDVGGGDAAVNQALNHDIQGVRIFGLVGLRAGRLF